MKALKLIFMIMPAIMLFSCQNQDDLTADLNSGNLVLKSAGIAVTDVTVESVLAETTYEAEFFAESEHLLRELSHLRRGGDLLRGRYCPRYEEGDMPYVTIDTAATGYPIVITIAYGDSTVLHHGKVISGTVSIEISAPKHTDGATRTITYTDCMVDSVSINGVSTEVFSGDNTNSSVTTTTFATFVLADGTVLQLSGEHTREWLAGQDTPLVHEDDLIQITGSDEISSSNGDVWTKQITEPLVKSGECRNIVQGVVQYLTNNVVIAELNYGDGTCDDVAVLTSNGESVEIQLKDRMAKAHLDGHSDDHKRGH